jgi:cytochrome d ubiquinol oxidase subunit II
MLGEACAALMLAALVAYAVTGGADFGGGVWDLWATGPRRAAQRGLIERAIAPVWEANHVWLIFVVVVLFTAFPAVYARVSTVLHIPLTALLLGIVARGSAFVFRHYGARAERGWGRVFAVASVVTPLMLGIVVGAVTAGGLGDGAVGEGRSFASVYVAPWLAPFPIAVGVLALVLFAFLAATYLAWEAEAREGDAVLAGDFRLRALVAGVLLAPAALVAALLARTAAPDFAARFAGSAWTWPLQLATAAVAITALVALARRRYRLARAAAIAQVALIVGGWGLAQRPFLVAPDLTIAAAQAPRATLVLVIPVVLVGMGILVPSLYWLFRVFKRASS